MKIMQNVQIIQHTLHTFVPTMFATQEVKAKFSHQHSLFVEFGSLANAHNKTH